LLLRLYTFLCRLGYIFREGDLGSGYYRKDVARQYHAAAGIGGVADPEQPAESSEEAASISAVDLTAAVDRTAASDTSTKNATCEEERRRLYVQRLLSAPPSMHSVIADPTCCLLFTASLGSADKAARVWQLCWDRECGEDGSSASPCPRPQLLRTLTNHTEAVLSLALSPCGGLLFTGSHDHTIRVWSTADWSCLQVLKGHGGGVRALAVSPDGATLYSAAGDNTIRVSCSHQHCQVLAVAEGASVSCASQLSTILLTGVEPAALGVPPHHAWPTRPQHMALVHGAVAQRRPAGHWFNRTVWRQHAQGEQGRGWAASTCFDTTVHAQPRRPRSIH
jgi:hypothetical protein